MKTKKNKLKTYSDIAARRLIYSIRYSNIFSYNPNNSAVQLLDDIIYSYNMVPCNLIKLINENTYYDNYVKELEKYITNAISRNLYSNMRDPSDIEYITLRYTNNVTTTYNTNQQKSKPIYCISNLEKNDESIKKFTDALIHVLNIYKITSDNKNKIIYSILFGDINAIFNFIINYFDVRQDYEYFNKSIYALENLYFSLMETKVNKNNFYISPIFGSSFTFYEKMYERYKNKYNVNDEKIKKEIRNAYNKKYFKALDSLYGVAIYPRELSHRKEFIEYLFSSDKDNNFETVFLVESFNNNSKAISTIDIAKFMEQHTDFLILIIKQSYVNILLHLESNSSICNKMVEVISTALNNNKFTKRQKQDVFNSYYNAGVFSYKDAKQEILELFNNYLNDENKTVLLEWFMKQ